MTVRGFPGRAYLQLAAHPGTAGDCGPRDRSRARLFRQIDHSPKFRAKVEALVPDYKRRQEWLRENERLLRIRMVPG
jgi:hypothetical protein